MPGIGEQAYQDGRNMRRAIHLAQVGLNLGVDPYGCVIVDQHGDYIGVGIGTGSDTDPTAHSEMHAIQEACHSRGLLHGCTLVSTHEPCAMCCGAITHAKLSRVVYGSSRADLPHQYRQCHRDVTERLGDTSEPPEVIGGVLRDECIALLLPPLVFTPVTGVQLTADKEDT